LHNDSTLAQHCELESNHSSQVPTLGGVTIFALPAVSLMPSLMQW